MFFSNAFGDVLTFNPDTDPNTVSVCLAGEEGMKRDYFGSYDPARPGSMAYHWRQVAYHPTFNGGCVLGVHGNSGYLFTFRPPRPGQGALLRVLRRITSAPSQACGMWDQFSYGYLGFAIGSPSFPDHLFYLTGSPFPICLLLSFSFFPFARL